REVLRLRTEPVAMLIGFAAFALEGAVEKVAAVELHSGFGGQYLENPPSFRIIGFGCQHRRTLRRSVQHPVMIVSFAELYLRVFLVDAGANGSSLGEVERRALYWH